MCSLTAECVLLLQVQANELTRTGNHSHGKVFDGMKTTESAMNLQLLRHRAVLWSTVLVLLPVPRLPAQQH